MRVLPCALSCVVAGLVLVSAAGATGAGMHPHLGARLAGMGAHGVVNLQSAAKAGKLCWTFELGKVGKPTRAAIHVGTTNHVLVELGMHYTAKGCTHAPAMTLEHLEARPASYWVFVDTKGHPGDLRGKLSAGMAHM
jgi:hypothetical protein